MGNVYSMVNKNVLLKTAVADVSIQWTGFAIGWILKTEKFYDLAGSSTFLYLTWASLIWAKRSSKAAWFPRQTIQNSCVSIWAIRLGTYLFSRILQDGEDRRFRRAKESMPLFFTFWTVQALWVFLTLLPTLILNMKNQDKTLTAKDYIGWGIWGIGFLTEMIADFQKSRFRSDLDNRGKFITTGLWSLCRHPNYLGEILMWAGLFLPASSVMSENEYYSVISPFFVAYLLTKVSGIPLLERHADKKWGALPEYQRYKTTTAKLIPYIW